MKQNPKYLFYPLVICMTEIDAWNCFIFSSRSTVFDEVRKTFSLTLYVRTLAVRVCSTSAPITSWACTERTASHRRRSPLKTHVVGHACARKLPSNSRRSLVDLTSRVNINRPPSRFHVQLLVPLSSWIHY